MYLFSGSERLKAAANAAIAPPPARANGIAEFTEPASSAADAEELLQAWTAKEAAVSRAACPAEVFSGRVEDSGRCAKTFKHGECAVFRV